MSRSNPGLETGVARLKPVFIVPDHERKLRQECILEEDKKQLLDGDKSEAEKDTAGVASLSDEGPSRKKQRLSRHEKSKLRGQNKARPIPFKFEREKSLCHTLIGGQAENTEPLTCSNQKCTFIHNIEEYLGIKPPDIGPVCYLYSIQGHCPRGIACRFGAQHINSSGKNITDASLYEKYQSGGLRTLNSLTKDFQHHLRKWQYDFSKSVNAIKSFDAEKKNETKLKATDSTASVAQNSCVGREDKDTACITSSEDQPELITTEASQKCGNDDDSTTENTATKNEDILCYVQEDKKVGPVSDQDIILSRPREKTTIDWQDKLYLSPLTTVGNLPFRRVCKEFGVDITCGEMAMANSILQGKPQEWALVKRHVSEDLFGVQLCGGNPYVMTKCAQLLEEHTNIDFIDVNLGCPIEFVYQRGEGSGLLKRDRALSSVIQCMSRVLTIPLTVKTRTGVFTDKNIAHKLIPKFRQWGVSLVTVHGRSREQRYTKLADWPYIEQCAELASPMPLFLNGDILSFEDYERARKECPIVAGVMIGRGALIKPWIFTEIKEKRHWDISSSERLEILKKYVNYGLEHWGSDTKGVENTRRFLLEWLSFLYRYIPIGILEKPPQHINERPPFYHGRDDLETLMASGNCQDWIKISEMLLGPVPDKFNFLPKHKANAWN